MKHTELRAAVLDALEKHDTGATLFDGRPAVFDEADFPAIAVYLTGAEYTGEELDSDTWQAELHIEVFLPAQVPDSELDSWMESRIYPVMSDIPYEEVNHLILLKNPGGKWIKRDLMG
ncbi:phage tail terminator protein [Escherichia sp. MOD1-EC4560]|uniref:phage tail terminator protein n=1 Tax=unclassified Escherichia TaxID=2608889 RepID=UPI00403F9E38